MDRLKNANISIFQQIISEELVDKIDRDVAIALANIIAIDYEIRLKSTVEAEDHISNCLNKLRKFLGKRVILDKSFSTILILFAVAISWEDVSYQDGDNILDKSEDIIIDTLINTNFGDNNPEEREIIKLILKDWLLTGSNYQLTNFMQDKSKIFCTELMRALKKHHNPLKVSSNIKIEINRIAHAIAKHNQQKDILNKSNNELWSKQESTNILLNSEKEAKNLSLQKLDSFKNHFKDLSMHKDSFTDSLQKSKSQDKIKQR